MRLPEGGPGITTRSGGGEVPSRHADTVAIVVAGGVGERFGDARGKQFVELCGRPLLAWSLIAFDRSPSVAAIVLVCPVGRQDEVQADVLFGLALSTPVTTAPAGPTRQASVASGLAVAEALVREWDDSSVLVAVHDGARPLVTAAAVESVLTVLRDGGPDLAGAIAAAPVTDTLKRVEGGVVIATPDRSVLWSAMTPQAFRLDALLEAHAAARAAHVEGTDDASLVERVGGRVRCVATPRDNLKVTVPEDLAIAEALLSMRLHGSRPAGGPGSGVKRSP